MLALESTVSGNIRNFFRGGFYLLFGGIGLGSAPVSPKIYYCNPGLFRTLVYSGPEEYSEPCQAYMM